MTGPLAIIALAIAAAQPSTQPSAPAASQPETQPGSQAQIQSPTIDPDNLTPLQRAAITRQQLGQIYAQAGQLEPPRRLGLRTQAIRAATIITPDLVVVPTPEAAEAAIAGWAPLDTFPVLIDDGSPRAAEDIARFARAFKPRSVVRWTPADADLAEAAPYAGEVFGAGAFKPQLLIATDPEGPAHAAALALARGRLGITVDVPKIGDVDTSTGPAIIEPLKRALEQAATDNGLNWNTIGDDLDAVVVATETPVRVRIEDAPRVGNRVSELALTDLVTRPDGWQDDRWAWAGQLAGTPASTLYQVMCGLFLPIEAAFVADGYPNEAPWNEFDGTQAAAELEPIDLRISIFDEPSASLTAWRARTGPGLAADLVLMNTKGNPDFFDLAPGTARAADVPHLFRPAAAVIVHSWSATAPLSEATVGGRWLLNGAYTYHGSVQEPYLSAFIPTPQVAKRFAGGYPLGLAARFDSGPAWKINYLGDPLVSPGHPPARHDERTLPFEAEQTEVLNESLAPLLRAERYPDAVRALLYIQRDDAAAALAERVLDRPASEIEPVTFALALPAAFRSRRYETVLRCFERLPQAVRESSYLRDCLWNAARLAIADSEDAERWIARLEQNPRQGQEFFDFIELAKVAERRVSPRRAIAIVQQAQPFITAPPLQRLYDEELARLRRIAG